MHIAMQPALLGRNLIMSIRDELLASYDYAQEVMQQASHNLMEAKAQLNACKHSTLAWFMADRIYWQALQSEYCAYDALMDAEIELDQLDAKP
jgi:hypothetical protein